jgi:hypothetical protein
MSFYRIEKKMIYTEVVYVEADSLDEAKDRSGEIEGDVMHDDIWHDSDGCEVSEEEYGNGCN